MAAHKVNFITGNANKLREVKAILEPEIEVLSKSIDLEEVQGTLEEVTESKCRRAADLVRNYLIYPTNAVKKMNVLNNKIQVKGPVLVEDTALCYNALSGLPGAYIKWFMTSIGHQGLNNLLAAYTDKSAEAVCTFGYCAGPGEKVILFQGRCPGKIVPPRGPPDFGMC
ncbi:Ham1 family protein [Fusarium odoratissimum NRRL 54006]|uniref:Ham1 family protein n=1 Tax=Fusarium odoratissimum (strain NRRL 54006) TaxID=1089451 RepID=X0KG32_FUSO5|nr:Ham1 family protein [Fusarium odoratissimum NRRL 54006]XP_031069781.1 Ham1 family protein [Fusarium odoratissimum NRRL 54006]EXM07691.1 Ham1 family protein [Fusarium odoratissimum NRRL 54006]EXM07692.1 Ham1 family protein [Fusarium odoratissimum NRRL 54006]